MTSLKVMAKQAKRRLGTGFWAQCRTDVNETVLKAESRGENPERVKCRLYGNVIKTIRGEKEDEFYIKVKNFLIENGEASDAIGRLTDREYYDKLSYEEKQRYTMQLSAKYLEALEKYRRECGITSP